VVPARKPGHHTTPSALSNDSKTFSFVGGLSVFSVAEQVKSEDQNGSGFPTKASDEPKAMVGPLPGTI